MKLNENKKEVLRTSIISLVLFVLIIMLGIFIITSLKNSHPTTLPETKPINPQIKEEYIISLFKEYKKYNGNIILDKKTNEIILTNDIENTNITHYLLGKYNLLYDELIPIYIKDNNQNYNDYKIQIENNKMYYINNNEISETFELIYPIKINEDYKYFILKNEDSISILNLQNNETIKLDETIIELPLLNFEDKKYNNDNYLIAKNENNKYGVIDYNNKIIIDFIYDDIQIYNNDNFIIKENNKYKILNNKKETITQNHDIIYYNNKLNNYFISIKDKKISIFKNTKQLTNYEIDYNFNIDHNIEYIILYNNLYLTIADNNNKITNYLIDDNGIKQTINNYLEPIKDKNENIMYFYSQSEENNEIKIIIYNLNYENIYSIILPINKKENINIKNTVNENIYQIINDKSDQIYYLDLKKKKEITELEAIYQYFDNGYGFTLNNNKELKIYKKEKLLNTYSNVDEILGNYYFAVNKNDNTSQIYTIEFKKRD